MPLYDFRCRACAHEFEALVRGGSATVCSSCGSADVERLPAIYPIAMRTGGLSQAARKAVARQQRQQHRDQAAFQDEIEKKHLDD